MGPRTIRLTPDLQVAVSFAVLAAGGCRGPASMPAPEQAPASAQCILPTGHPGEPRELAVAVARPEDSMVIARRQPEPLLRLDCLGAASPGAAESWTPDSAHRTWTLVLAPAPIALTAPMAAAEWRTRPDAATALRYSSVLSVVPLDERRLVVTLDRPADSVPLLFADPALGLITDTLQVGGTTFVARRPASGDLRDALDAGADILRTGDPAILDYARTRDDFIVHPLPWSRTYVLVVPPGHDSLGPLIPRDTAAFRAGLARDAVRTEARGAEPPFWWNETPPCPAPEARPVERSGPRPNVVVHDREDAVARDIAGRIVALSDDATMAARGLPEQPMAGSLRNGAGRAYVVAVPRRALVPCRELARWPPGSAVIPLIDTRTSAIVRRGVPRLAVEFDGAIRPVEEP